MKLYVAEDIWIERAEGTTRVMFEEVSPFLVSFTTLVQAAESQFKNVLMFYLLKLPKSLLEILP